MLSKKKLAAAGLVGLMIFNNFTPALALSSTDAVTVDGVTVPVFAEPDDAEISIDMGRTLGKIQWSQFNVPQSQTIDFGFTQAGQTILNYVAPQFSANPSFIAGNINTMGSNNIAGRVMIINPNGITLVGAHINDKCFNCVEGQPSLLFSTLDLKTPFDEITDSTTDIQFQTFTDTAGFANGIYSKSAEVINGNGMEESSYHYYRPTYITNLKELTFLGNGIALDQAKIRVTYDGRCYDYDRFDEDNSNGNGEFFNNYLNIITAGEATVSLTPEDRQLTPITIDSPNLVPACTFNTETEEFEDGGVRYFDFTADGERLDNLGSKFQIALCNKRCGYIVGPGKKHPRILGLTEEGDSIYAFAEDGTPICLLDEDGAPEVYDVMPYGDSSTSEVPFYGYTSDDPETRKPIYDWDDNDNCITDYDSEGKPLLTDGTLAYCGGCHHKDGPKGIVRIENRSDYFNSTGYKSIVKVATRIDAQGAIDVGDPTDQVVFLISKNPGQVCTETPENSPAHLLICAGSACSSNTNIFVNKHQVRVTDVDAPTTNRVVLDPSFPCGLASRNTVIDTNDELNLPLPLNVANKPDTEICSKCDCLGDCGTPPDPCPPPPPPPPPPPGGGDGGGGAAVAIPLGVAGAGILGFLGVPALTAAVPAAESPYVAYTPATVYSCPVPMYAGAPGQTTGAAAGMNTVSPYQFMQQMARPMGQTVSPYYTYPTGGAAPVNPYLSPQSSALPVNPNVPVNQNVSPYYTSPQSTNASMVTGQSGEAGVSEEEKQLNQTSK